MCTLEKLSCNFKNLKKNKRNILNVSNAKIPSMSLAALPEYEKLKFSCIYEY